MTGGEYSLYFFKKTGRKANAIKYILKEKREGAAACSFPLLLPKEREKAGILV